MPAAASPATATKEDNGTIFMCRTCDRATRGWNDGKFADAGWSRIDNIDGPDAICPHCQQDHSALDGLREDYPDAVIRATADDTSSNHKDVPSGCSDSGREPFPADANVRKLVPLRIEIVTFKDGDRWAGEVHGYTTDVDTGKPTRIRTRGHFANDPTADDLHGLVTTWFDHELREQLDMNPHAPTATPSSDRACAGCGRDRPLRYSHGTCSPLCCRIVADAARETTPPTPITKVEK